MKDHSFIFNSKDGIRALKALACFSPILVLIAWVNLKVDPAGLYEPISTAPPLAAIPRDIIPLIELHPKGEIEKKAAKIVLSGESVAVPEPFHERLFFKSLILNQSSPKDLVIFGSSQTVQLSQKHFPDLDILNASILSYSMNDLLGLAGCYEKIKMYPKRILIAVEPSLLNAATATLNPIWKSAFEEEVQEMNILLNVEKNSPNRPLWMEFTVPTFLSPSYFQESLGLLSSRFRPKRPEVDLLPQSQVNRPALLRTPIAPLVPQPEAGFDPFPTRASEGPFLIYHPDGSVTYKTGVHDGGEEDAERRAIDFASKPRVSGLDRFERLDPNLKTTLEALIVHLIKKGTQVAVLLLPYHPEAYERLIRRPDTRIIQNAEVYFLSLKSLGATVFGSFDPKNLGYNKKDFFDHSHLRTKSIDHLQTSEFFK